MEEHNAVTQVIPTQTGVVTQAPGQTHVVQRSHHSQTVQNFMGGTVGEIVMRSFSLAFSFAVLIAAIVTLAALNSIGEYENADGSRGAAGWMVFVAIAALLFHGAMILVRILYATSVIEKNFNGYAFTNAIICVIFGLAFLSGGIASAVYAADNSDLHDRFCDFSTSGICGDLGTVYRSEVATAAFSIMSVVALIPLFIGTLCSGIYKWQEEANQSSEVVMPSAPPY